jgi:hypothetical protein
MAGLAAHAEPPHAPREDEPVEVRNGRLGRIVAAIRDIPMGETVIKTWGEQVPQRSKQSIQVEMNLHVVPDGVAVLMNHSCDPNCGVVIRSGVRQIEIRALRPIKAGEEITVDYDTFEYEVSHLAGPCLCGAARCRGTVAGYKHLPADVRARYGDYIAEYLRIIPTEATVPVGV